MNKINLFQSILKKTKAEGYFISKSINIRYLMGDIFFDCLLIILKNKIVIIVNSIFEEEAEIFLKNKKIKKDNFVIFYYNKNFFKFLVFLIKKLKINILFFEKSILFSEYLTLFKFLNKVKCKFVMGPEIIEKLRMIKTNKEIELIKKSSEITNKLFNKIINEIKPGITEIDIKKKIEYFIFNEDVDSFSFPIIITSGYRTSLPHGLATEKKIKKNEPILIDMGVNYKGYCSDMTRMIYVGKPEIEFINIYKIIEEIQFLILEYLSKDRYSFEIDLFCRKIIKKYGYEKNFIHSSGHGVGLEIHEDPIISEKSKILLKNNMVFTIEPGIYLKKKFGVRIENLFILKNSKANIISKKNQELVII